MFTNYMQMDFHRLLGQAQLKHAAELATLRTELEKAHRDNAHLKAEFTKMPARVNDLKRTAGALRSQLKNEQETRERQVEIARGGIARENAHLRAEFNALACKILEAHAAVLGVEAWHLPACSPNGLITACRITRDNYESLKKNSHVCTITVPYGKALRAADHLRRALEVARGKMKWLQDQHDYFWGENKRLRQRERIWNALFVMYVAAWVAMYIYTRHFY